MRFSEGNSDVTLDPTDLHSLEKASQSTRKAREITRLRWSESHRKPPIVPASAFSEVTVDAIEDGRILLVLNEG